MARATKTAKKAAKPRESPSSAKSPGADTYTPARFCELVGGDRHEFAKRLTASGAKAVGQTSQKGQLFRLRDLVAVLLGGAYEAERLRKTKEEADKLAIGNARSRGELVEIAAVKKLGEKVMVALRNRILAMPLTAEEQDRCLKEILSLASMDWSREG